MPVGSSAIDRISASRMLDNFKEKNKEILFDSMPFTDTSANELMVHEYTMNGLLALKSRISGIEKAYQIKKDLVTEKRQTLEEALMILDNSVKQSEDSIQANKDTIDFKTKYLDELAKKWEILKEKINHSKIILLEYVAHIYSIGNTIYTPKSSVDILQTLLLTEWSTDFLLRDMTYKSLLSEMGQKFLDEYKMDLKDSYVLSTQIESEISSLQTLKNSLAYQMWILISQKEEREKLIEMTKWQEKLFDSYILAGKNAEIAIDDAWQNAKWKYQDTLDATLKKYGCWDERITEEGAKKCHQARFYFMNEKKLQDTSFPDGTVNILKWPIASREMSTYYRDTGYYNAFGSQHDAIDIKTDQWSSVYSSAPWYVYYTLLPTSGGYSYLAIKHRDGFVTVYGHLSEILVSEWQFVESGEIIAKSWGLPWTPGAGPMTTGPHLHFEVWKDKESVDPLRYMSIAQIDYAYLPARYEEKFITDIVEKSGNSKDASKYEKKFSIQGDTEKRRQEYLLSTYATPDFQDWNLWIDSALSENIDPSFLMCVWLAETTLGNHLKTSYNIWNIGNTDSGGTYSFESPTEWVVWMAKTFNNRFLKKYDKLSELSRWWNEDGSIYASSGGNWHNNIMKCLSALKWRFVEDDYLFRIAR